MSSFAIVADATCDLPESLQKQYNIRVIPGHVVLPDKREIMAVPSWDWCSCEEFYRSLKRNPTEYTTSPANVIEFTAVMEEYASRGEAVLIMTISGGISSAYRFALQAKTAVLEKYPQAQIECVDSRRFGPGFGLMTVHAALCREQGMDLAQTCAYLEENKNKFRQAGWHEDLAFVAKKGRITHAKAFLGTLAGVKPIGEFDSNGLTSVIGKVKGTRAALEVLLSYVAATAEEPQEQIFFIAHSNRLKMANEYKALLEERFHPKAIYVGDIYACCGINVGPGLVAAYYVGKPISQDLSEERNLIESFAEGV